MENNKNQLSEAIETLNDMLRIMRYSEYTNTPMNISADCISAFESAVNFIENAISTSDSEH